MSPYMDIASLISDLGNTVDLERVRQTAVALAKPGATSKAAALPGYGEALSKLIAVARDAPDERSRVYALSVLARLRKQPNKPFRPSVEAQVAEPMRPLLAMAREVSDAKERDYLVQALRLVRFDGKLEYLAEAIAAEEQSRSDARSSSALALVEEVGDLTLVFEHLGAALRRQEHETQDPDRSRAIRLSRALEVVKASVPAADPAVTQRTGKAYADLLRFS